MDTQGVIVCIPAIHQTDFRSPLALYVPRGRYKKESTYDCPLVSKV